MRVLRMTHDLLSDRNFRYYGEIIKLEINSNKTFFIIISEE